MLVLDMAWRRNALTVAALAALLAAAGLAAAHHGEADGWTSTGDVDTYGAWSRTSPQLACTQDIYQANVTLQLLHPAPGDRVLVSGQKTTADAALATWEDPTVTISYTSGGCGGVVEVVGLTVSGDLGYRLGGPR